MLDMKSASINRLTNELRYNGSGCGDAVAERAIRQADHAPHEIPELMDVIKKDSRCLWI